MSSLTVFRIRPYSESDSPSITNYCLPAEQAIYTSLPIDVIEACKNARDKLPFLVFVKNELVGCFALYTNQADNVYTSNQDALLLKSFSIDARFQNRGFALETLRTLPEVAQRYFPEKNEIILTVHHTNIPARNLYRKAGFVDKGLRYQGEFGEELILHFSF